MVYTAVWWRIPGAVLTELNIFMVRLVSHSIPVLQYSDVSGLSLLSVVTWSTISPKSLIISFSSSASMDTL